ncbi:hypothetical protein ACFL07_01285 [Pseudomonadota bacterium]
MKLTRFIFVFALMLFAATALAAKQDKKLICHVGNEVGVDAGKIDLIVVAKADKHLDNASHEFGGISDYEPHEVGASGVGTEDSNGDGIDDGCEPGCPCWFEDELQSVTAANHRSSRSCSGYLPTSPDQIFLQNEEGSTPEVEGGFSAVHDEGLGLYVCTTRDFPQEPRERHITSDEALVCYGQILDRCAEIGDPIIPD